MYLSPVSRAALLTAIKRARVAILLTSANIHVTDFRISHLTFRQSDSQT